MMQAKVQKILMTAIAKRVTDIYFTPHLQNYLVVYRTPLEKQLREELDLATGKKIINLLKFKGAMVITETRRPQLGAFVFVDQGQQYFLRLSTVGNFLDQESLVIRIIYPPKQISKSYFFPQQIALITQQAKQRGLLIFAGPMSSGKTTTMYQIAKNFSNQQVLCIEDPIEIHEPSFLQLEVNQKAEMSYAHLLKVGLRQHPDIFIIGEIRDELTAQIAVNAALSGHLVLTTVHAKSARGVYQRLLNLGVDDFNIAQVVNLICYQRLIPTTDGKARVLFEFYQPEQGLPKNTKTSTEWRGLLEKCHAQNWITQATKITFQDG